ncbi:MAG: hypothetical protein V3V56_06655, partial [bacterium]
RMNQRALALLFVFLVCALWGRASAADGAPEKSAGKILFCNSEEWAVNLSKISNGDIAGAPALKGLQGTVVLREAALQKVCFFLVPTRRSRLRTIYRGPKKGDYSVVESEIVSSEDNRSFRGFVLTREGIPSP